MATQPSKTSSTSASKSSNTDLRRLWTDRLVLLVSLLVTIGSTVYLLQNGMFKVSLATDEKIVWHLIRSAGFVAYVLMWGSMIWGLMMSSKIVKDWSPGAVSMTMHSTLSWLAVIVSLMHAVLLMFDDYFTYTLGDIFVPFAGAYRPEAVGLGTLAFWLTLIVTISFAFKKFIGQKTWRRLHYVTYGAFAMMTAHGLFAGTDSNRLGVQLLFASATLIIVGLTAWRVARIPKKVAKPARA